MPREHVLMLHKGEEMAANLVMPRKDINQLFEDGYLAGENGYRQLTDGSTFVSVLTKMPKVTIEMIDWWFWWHAKEGVRYQIWYPDMHYDIDSDFQGYYNDNTKSYRERLHLSSHLVTEDIGVGKDKILIDFMHPSQFGFDKNKLDDTITIICARVGAPDKGVWATEMCHFVRKVDKGVEMRSRFWIGHKVERMGGFAQGVLNTILNTTFVKKNLLPKGLGKAMFHHCAQEYHNLADILPQVYAEEQVNHVAD